MSQINQINIKISRFTKKTLQITLFMDFVNHSIKTLEM